MTETSTSTAPKRAPPLVLHEQTGLMIRRNARNNWVIARLHYLADPCKRDPKWKAEAKAGIPHQKFLQEYEIDYTALFGEKVFPQIQAYRERIVVKTPYPNVGPKQTCFAGFDFGRRNPSAFGIFTIDKNSDGEKCLSLIWELYEPAKDLKDYASKMLACPYYDRLQWIAADKRLWNLDQNVLGAQVTSVASQLHGLGVRKLIRGDDNEEQWVAAMGVHWGNLEHHDATFKIWHRCPNAIGEFEKAAYTKQPEGAAGQKNYKEKLKDFYNHALDMTKYCMNAAPRVRKVPEIERERGAKIPQRKTSETWRRHMT